MNVEAINVIRMGYGSAMRKLELPRDLQPDGRDWALTDAEFHQRVSDKLSECQKIAPNSARIVANDLIYLMPAEGVEWEDAFAAVKEILANY